MLKLVFKLLNVEFSCLILIKSTDNVTEHFLCSQAEDKKVTSKRLDMVEACVEQVCTYWTQLRIASKCLETIPFHMFSCFYIQNITRNCFYHICIFFPYFGVFLTKIIYILNLRSTVNIKRWVVAYPFDTLTVLGYHICSTLIKQGQYSKY